MNFKTAHISSISIIENLSSSVASYDSVEKEHLDTAQRWLDSKAEVNFVSKYLIIEQNTNQILLVHDKKTHLWHPLGVNIINNEYPKEGVERELKDKHEIEAEFILDKPIFLSVENSGYLKEVCFWYLVKGDKKHLKLDADKQWFDLHDLPIAESEPSLKRFFIKWRKKLLTLNSYNISSVDYAKKTNEMNLKEEIHKFLPLLPSSSCSVIDIGCGPGRDAKSFCDLGLNVVGIDFSSMMIKNAKRMAPKAVFHIMDIEQMTFPNETFEAAWANCSLLHIAKHKLPPVLQKINKILKPLGLLYFSVKKGHENDIILSDFRYGGLTKSWTYYEEKELENYLIEAGFEIIDIATTDKSNEYQTHPLIKIIAKKLTIHE